MKITVIITTYRRPKQLEQLTEALKAQKPDVKIAVISDEPEIEFSTENIDVLLSNKYNLGKRGYWRTVNSLWAHAIKTKADYYVQMVDDSLPKDDFFEEMFKIWDSIDDNQKVAMHIANNGREENWTRFKRRSYNEDLYLTQTTEMSFLCLPEFIEYRIPPVSHKRWKRDPLAGSGVGPALNNHWVRKRLNIYGVKRSLIKKNETESLMNPQERKKNPWILL